MKVPVFAAILLFLSSFVNAQSSELNSKNPLFIDSIHVSGTRSLDSNQLNEIIGPLNQLKIGGTEEIRERIRFQFQEHGYFDVEVKSVSVKPIDPLASPRPVDVEAEVNEGSRFRFGEIQFTGNHALNAEVLRAKFPIQKGEYFSRGTVGSGLEALRDVYGKLGYIEFYCIPDTTTSDGKVSLHIEVHEGRPYRMGTLEFAGNTEVAEQLRPRWKLDAGTPYDAGYLKSFFQENQSIFPPQFDLGHSTTIARNCGDNTVTVFVELGPKHPSVSTPRDVDCDKPSDNNSK